MMRPEYMTREDLLAVLDDVRARVAAGDSYEGFIQYLRPHRADPPDGFRVEARWRIGNLQGQGGMRMVGTLDAD